MRTIECIDVNGNTLCFSENDFIERKSVYGILIKDNSVLVVKDPWGKRWSLPGGGIDIGESPEQSLTREFQEETGMLVTAKQRLLSDVTYFMPSTEKKPWKTLRDVYLVKNIGGTLREDGNNQDVLQAKYMDIKEAIKVMKEFSINKPFADLLKMLIEK